MKESVPKKGEDDVKIHDLLFFLMENLETDQRIDIKNLININIKAKERRTKYRYK